MEGSDSHTHALLIDDGSFNKLIIILIGMEYKRISNGSVGHIPNAMLFCRKNEQIMAKPHLVISLLSLMNISIITLRGRISTCIPLIGI